MRRHATTTLLVVIAVLLTANLMRPSATAQPQVSIAPYVTSVALDLNTANGEVIYRSWSDGLIEHNFSGNQGATYSGWQAVPE